ncbi:leucine-rich_repeat domain-containing protein [Hexamita inflata]|uniref:Leucine-rich repeat domain-containing protein n=1 Tax=Hexamita inflata TaxID=28002 RepID=A0AA86UV88_9EUKA|nr:leucine-rich repeat domain-containing protein [Hexamita inflata]
MQVPISNYDQKMIERYQNNIKYRELEIRQSLLDLNLSFISYFDILKLSVFSCKQVTVLLQSTSIKELNIEYCDIQNTDGLKLEQLEILRLSGNQISSISINGFKKLKELDLSQNSCNNLQCLEQTKLVKLNLSDNNFKCCQQLTYLQNLKELFMDKNQKLDITTLQHLTSLSVLSLSFCDLVDISALNSLINLTYLDLMNNSIKNVTPLSSLSKLAYLDLQFNKIYDFTPIIFDKMFEYNFNNQIANEEEQE